MRKVAYIVVFVLTILPFLILAYLVELRLFILFPVLWITGLFFRGIEITPSDRFVKFYMEENDNE